MAQVREHISIYALFNLREFEKSSQTLQRKMKMTGSQLRSVGRNLSMSITAPIVGILGLAAKEFADFDQSMRRVQAIQVFDDAQMVGLIDLAKELGISTRFTADEVGNLMYRYSQLGFSAKEITDITELTLQLANATGEDLAESALVAGGTLRGFRLESEEMERVVNVMAKAFTSSALDLEKWKVSVSKVAPIASALGISIEEVAAMFGVLADVNIEASIIGTSMRKIFLDLASSGMSYEEAMGRISSAAVDMHSKQSKLNDDIISSADGMKKAAMAEEVFEKRAVTTALTLTQFHGKVKENIVAFGDWKGNSEDMRTSLKKMSDTIDKSLKMSFIRLQSATSGLGIEFGEVLAPKLQKITAWFAKVAIKMAGLNDMTKKLIVLIAIVTAALPLVTLGVGLLAGAVSALATAIGVAAAPIYLTIAAIGLLAVAIGMAYIEIKNNKEAFIRLFENLFGKIANVARGAVASMVEGFAKLFEFAGMKGWAKKMNKTASEIRDSFSVIKDPIEFKGFGFDLDTKKMEYAAERLKKKFADLLGFFGDDDKGETEEEIERKIKEQKAYAKDLINSTRELFWEVSKNLGDNLFLPKDNKAIRKGVKDTLKEYKDAFIQEAGIISEEIKQVTIKIGNNLTAFTTMINESVQDFASEGIARTAEMFGKMLTDEDFTSKDFGRGILEMVAGFMQQLGGLLIAWGINFELFEKSIKSGQGWLAVIAGAAMIAAGAAIKGSLSKGLDGGGSSYSGSSYGGGASGYGGTDFSTEVVIQGREMILVQKREGSFRR